MQYHIVTNNESIKNYWTIYVKVKIVNLVKRWNFCKNIIWNIVNDLFKMVFTFKFY